MVTTNGHCILKSLEIYPFGVLCNKTWRWINKDKFWGERSLQHYHRRILYCSTNQINIPAELQSCISSTRGTSGSEVRQQKGHSRSTWSHGHKSWSWHGRSPFHLQETLQWVLNVNHICYKQYNNKNRLWWPPTPRALFKRTIRTCKSYWLVEKQVWLE